MGEREEAHETPMGADLACSPASHDPRRSALIRDS
jgi:hypothetical protein